MANFTSLIPGGTNFGNIRADIILQSALQTFNEDLGFLSAIHSDLGGDALSKDASIQTRIFHKLTSSTTFAGNYNTVEDIDQEPISVTLDNHEYIAYALGDTEREKSDVTLLEQAGAQAAHGLARKVIDDLLAEIVAANSQSAGAAVAESSFSMDDAMNMAEQLDLVDAPKDGRWLLLSTKAYYGLLTDMTTVTNASFNINEGIRKADVGLDVMGMNIYTYNYLETGILNTCAVAGSRDSLVSVMRLPRAPEAGMHVGEVLNASDPTSGLSLQLRRKYDVMDASEQHALTCLYGHTAVKGEEKRIVHQTHS
jgi:hypothetical protein